MEHVETNHLLVLSSHSSWHSAQQFKRLQKKRYGRDGKVKIKKKEREGGGKEGKGIKGNRKGRKKEKGEKTGNEKNQNYI